MESERNVIVYKLVREKYGCYYSAFIGNSEMQLRYFISKFTEPKIGELFAFDTIEHARLLCLDLDLVVFEAEAQLSLRQVVQRGLDRRILFCNDLVCNYSKFWEGWNNKQVNNYRNMPPPKGTILCSKIKLTKRVFPLEISVLQKKVEPEKQIGLIEKKFYLFNMPI